MDLVISKEKLLSILKENRAKHHEKFVKAVAIYKEEAVHVLMKNIDNISRGVKLRVVFLLPVPEEHLKDYDRAIHSLELDTRNEIKLDDGEARCYVEDQWNWINSFLSNTVAYSNPTATDGEEED